MNSKIIPLCHTLLFLAVTMVIFSCQTGRTGQEVAAGPVQAIQYFDEDGRLQSEEHFYRNGALQRKMVYHAGGRLRNDYRYTYTPDGQLAARVDSATGFLFLVDYDSLGREIATQEILPGMRMVVKKYYKEDGRLRIDSTQKRTEATYNQLDEDGRVKAYWVIDENLDTLVNGEIAYDSAGRLVEEFRYESGALARHDQFNYRPDGQLEASSTYDAMEKKEHQLSYSYDGDGKLIESTLRYGGGKPDLVRKYTYTPGERLEETWSGDNLTGKQKEVYRYFSVE